MAITTGKTPSFARRLNTRLRTNPAFVELFKAVDRVVQTTVTEPRVDLSTVRDPQRHHRGDWINLPDGRRAIVNYVAVNEDGTTTVFTQVAATNETVDLVLPSNLKDRSVLIAGAQQHGFNYFSDTLSTQDYANINEWIEYYWPRGNTQSYINFMGFIKHVRLESDVLWTTEAGAPAGVALADDPNDDYPFLEPNYGQLKPVWAGGDNYPTSHVQLRYDAIEFPNVDETDLIDLFYLLAPIHLVLRRMAWDLNAQVALLQQATFGQISLHDTGSLQPGLNARPQSIFYTTRGGLALHDSAALFLPRTTVVPTLNLTLLRNHGFSAGFRLVPNPQTLHNLQLRFIDQNGKTLFTTGSAQGTRIYRTGDSLAVSLPIETLPADLPSTFEYSLTGLLRRQMRTLVRGRIVFVAGPNAELMLMQSTTAGGLRLTDTGLLNAKSKNIAPIYNYGLLDLNLAKNPLAFD